VLAGVSRRSVGVSGGSNIGRTGWRDTSVPQSDRGRQTPISTRSVRVTTSAFDINAAPSTSII
jgi:hypothetical protein